MESFSRQSPLSAILLLITLRTFSSFPQAETRLSNWPSRPALSTVSIEKASVSRPDTWSSMSTPNVVPFTSPWGIKAAVFFRHSIWGHGAKGRLHKSASKPVMALFPSSGRLAWEPVPTAVISQKASSGANWNSIPVLSFTSPAAFSSTESSKPSTVAFAFPGTTLTLVPASIFTSLGSASDGSNSPVKCPSSRPFSTFTTGYCPSGEKVMGASFSVS